MLSICVALGTPSMAIASTTSAPHVLRLIEVTHTASAGPGDFSAELDVSANHGPGFYEVTTLHGNPEAPSISATPFTEFGNQSGARVVGHEIELDGCGPFVCTSRLSGGDQLAGGVTAAAAGWFRVFVVAEGDHVVIRMRRAAHVSVRVVAGGVHRSSLQGLTVNAFGLVVQTSGDLATAAARRGSVAVAELPCFGSAGSGSGDAWLTASNGPRKRVSCSDTAPQTLVARAAARIELSATGVWWGRTPTDLLVIDA